ncbi:MAG TPA: PKD domain-containing protein [Chitinophagaceae bacterium]
MSLRSYRIQLFALLCCMVYGSLVRSQQGNIWYFGNFAGVSFNQSPPAVLTDGQLNTQEGTSVICDDNGNLLFYTNGRVVFNRNHDLMLNGAGLAGHVSSYQSCVIIPWPGNPGKYYIITADAWENNGFNGYHYTEVDMSLDNGFGGVTGNKNVLLTAPSSERLAAIKSADNSAYWIITNQWGSNIFRSFKVDCNGINTTPVVSAVGRPMTDDTYCNIGTLRVSPDGKHVIQTQVKGRLQSNPTNEYAQLFDFNDVTGQLSNPILIPLINDGYYFGAEFSPDSKLLYLVNPYSKSIHQLDITSGDITTILSSKTVLPGTNELCGAAIGADQKIYLTTGGPSLHVINQPNVKGMGCNLVFDQQKLSGGSKLTLPNIVPNLYAERPVNFTFQLIGACTGSIQFNAVTQMPGLVFQWDFGDGNTGSGINPVHTYSDANGEYLVKLTATNSANCVYEIISKRVRPSGEQVAAGFGIIADCGTLRVQISDSAETGNGQANYSWDFGDGNTSTLQSPVHQYTTNGTFMIRQIISSFSGCVSDTMDLIVDFTKPVISAGPDILVTNIQPIQLNATGASTYQWKPALYLDNPNIGNPVMKARDAVTYVVTGTNSGGCSNTDTLRVTIKENEIIEVPNAFVPLGTKNPVLRPVLRLVKGLNYFQVYNRWGQMVFSTKTIGHGWDGTFNGLPQPSGAYVWVLEAVDARGTIVRKKGSSLLIR